jgi:hypothetical protein
MLQDWIRGADLLEGYDGTFDVGGRGAGRFDEILGLRNDADIAAGWYAAAEWMLARCAPTARA